MVARTIAIGDVHGCARAFQRLVAEISPTSDDVIVPLGDYVDRGPDSRSVVDQLIALADRCRLIPLVGNHELMLLEALDSAEAREFWLTCGGEETLTSYGGSLNKIPNEHLAFFRGCRRYYETAHHIFVHANYDPDLSLDEQPDYLLFWEHVIFTLPAPHVSGKTAVVGHTPQTTGDILDLGHLLCIDTYCVGNGWLTALDVGSGRVWQTNRRGELRVP